jgi:hypothetical protein
LFPYLDSAISQVRVSGAAKDSSSFHLDGNVVPVEVQPDSVAARIIMADVVSPQLRVLYAERKRDTTQHFAFYNASLGECVFEGGNCSVDKNLVFHFRVLCVFFCMNKI